ncbi:MAG: Hsp20/alpha crystallin family protein [Candidatus Marinimicrobia bacterium]|nr:Hsp20/alpha crystallin family protein [Candidatus Neomarinimicrobiota bacterium]
MKSNKLLLIIGLILVLVVAIEGFYIFDLRQQIKDEHATSMDSLSYSLFNNNAIDRNDDPFLSLFTDLDNMQTEMDQLFGKFSHNFHGSPYFDNVFGDFSMSPALDFREENDKYIVEVELPGAENSSVDISVENNILNIKAETNQNLKNDKSNYKRSERFTGKMQRSLTLPEDADSDGLTSQLENGVLIITIPKQS